MRTTYQIWPRVRYAAIVHQPGREVRGYACLRSNKRTQVCISGCRPFLTENRFAYRPGWPFNFHQQHANQVDASSQAVPRVYNSRVAKAWPFVKY
jgi:hypothetical protein